MLRGQVREAVLHGSHSGANAVLVSELNFKSKEEVREVAEVFRKAFSPELPEKPALYAWLDTVESYKTAKAQNGSAFVCRRNGRIIGAAFGKLHDPLEHSLEACKKLGPGKHYYLVGLAVDPAFQRQKIATMLTRKRLAHARKLGCAAVYSYTYAERKPKVAQFEKEGFTRFHTEPTKEGTRVYYKKTL